jgi:ubiquinone/menaquinone biosynthesis C-methylase UbiE
MTAIAEHEKRNRQKFDTWAENFETRGSWFQYFQKRVISLIDFSSPCSFLDLGCGTGWAVRYVSDLMKGKGNCAGIDISEKMIEQARRLAAGMNNVVFHNASSENLPVEDGSIDNIICTFSFHHYANPVKALSEARRVLKPRGKFFILDATLDDFLTRLFETLFLKLDKSHVKQYTTNEFRRMFPEAGLTYLKSATILMYPIKVHIAEK